MTDLQMLATVWLIGWFVVGLISFVECRARFNHPRGAKENVKHFVAMFFLWPMFMICMIRL